jgi:hypothetical protein
MLELNITVRLSRKSVCYRLSIARLAPGERLSTELGMSAIVVDEASEGLLTIAQALEI